MTLLNSAMTFDHLHNNVTGILRVLITGVQEVNGDNLVGVYLRGSLALGDFDPDTSDIDFLVVTKYPVTEETFAVLKVFHTRLAKFPNPFAKELEGAYIDLDSLKCFQTDHLFPTLYRGEDLQLTVHQTNWVIERWTVREHGITVIGPDPKKLIAPISKEQLRSAVSVRLRDWSDWCNQMDDPAWRLPLNHIAYVVQTMCRALYTLACGEICSKPRAVEWALGTLTEPWCSLVEKSRFWRTDNITIPDDNIISEVRQFVLWVSFKAGLTQHNT
jgi:predicted nucleotidyltransferase